MYVLWAVMSVTFESESVMQTSAASRMDMTYADDE